MPLITNVQLTVCCLKRWSMLIDGRLLNLSKNYTSKPDVIFARFQMTFQSVIKSIFDYFFKRFENYCFNFAHFSVSHGLPINFKDKTFVSSQQNSNTLDPALASF
jgi:hypothetical protein